jgi:hypothetical protein
MSEFDPNTFPAQQFTNQPPAATPQGFSQLPTGAREFARQYLPEDDDSGCIGTFETVKEYKPAKSQVLREKATAAGREPDASCEVYEPVVFVRINIRGNDKMEVHRPAYDSDKKRFPFAWQEFLKGEQAADRGTPLSQLPGIDSPIVRRCHAINIFTIEDLAAVSDTHLYNIGTGARELRQKAVEFVGSHKYQRAVQPEVAELKQQNVEMKAAMDEQRKTLDKAMELINAQTAELEKARERKKPGRKPKAVVEQ